jgi:hypothetical protein
LARIKDANLLAPGRSMSLLSSIIKPLLRRPFTADELRSALQPKIDDFWWAREILPPLTANFENSEYSNGKSFRSVWKAGFDHLTEQTAAQPTWLAQRRELLETCVSAASWIALFRVILSDHEDNYEILGSLVEHLSIFQSNSENIWLGIM